MSARATWTDRALRAVQAALDDARRRRGQKRRVAHLEHLLFRVEARAGRIERRAWNDERAVVRAIQVEAARHRPGTLLLTGKVREHSTLGKAAFDAACWRLYQRRAISMHYHDHPLALSEVEREALVLTRGVGPDGADVYWIGIAGKDE